MIDWTGLELGFGIYDLLKTSESLMFVVTQFVGLMLGVVVAPKIIDLVKDSFAKRREQRR